MDAPRTVLLTGATGLLGTWLRRTAPTELTVVPLLHRRRLAGVDGPTADLRDAAAVDQAMAEVRPDLVLHAAYDQDEAAIVGATANLAAAARAVDATVLLISTDAVFGGDGVARDEAAVPDPVHDYGRWKVAAEQAVTDADPTGAAIVRLPLIGSLDPPDGAVARIAAEAAEGRTTTWFADELRQPAMADDLAAAIWRIVALPTVERAGAWHLMGPETLSRFAIAQRAAARLGLPADAVAGQPTPAGAVRPKHLHLSDDRARGTLGWAPRPIFAP